MTSTLTAHIKEKGLYRRSFEKDSCGFGLIANMDDVASHWLVATAIQSLARLTHRGAIAPDGKTGDGCGLLLKMPLAYMRQKAQQENITLTDLFAVGTIFLSTSPQKAEQQKKNLEAVLNKEGLHPAGWRTVPVCLEACGEQALRTLPRIEQIFVNTDHTSVTEFERDLFIARRRAEIVNGIQEDGFYVAGLSSRVLSYKGLMLPENLPVFYEDLNDPELESSICVFHQRFSTNTDPQWRLAQPFRFLAHNGEINTIQGNRNWAEARSHTLVSEKLPHLSELSPLVRMDSSDSDSLDNMLEVLLAGGLDIFHAMRLLVPAAWQNVSHFDPDLRAFYEYNSMHMEPWDGPAGIVLTDGRYAACSMDRNGLRPARYVITKNRHITLASEIGVYDYQPAEIETTGRLKPGEMIAVDTQTGKLLLPQDIDTDLKFRKPYRQWLDKNVIHLSSSETTGARRSDSPLPPNMLLVYEKMFGVTAEEKEQVIKPLAQMQQEAIGSMGDDTPLPVLSNRVRSLFDNFRQQFAQVTNPPIDPLREQIVMSLETSLGQELNPFADMCDQPRALIDSPILSEQKFNNILDLEQRGFPNQVFDLNMPMESKLSDGIQQLCDEVIQAVREEDIALVVLSDRQIGRGKMPIHALLACGAVHHALIAEGLRCKVNIIVETATTRDPHHFAVLIGYGATAIYPYLSYRILQHSQRTDSNFRQHDPHTLYTSYRQGIIKGLYKIISKMGIATITSYRGAQLFEIIGLHDEVVSQCFKGSISRLQGMNFEDLQEDQAQLAWRAWNPKAPITQGGLLKYMHGEEYHAYNPDVIQNLHKAVQEGSYDDYKIFSDHVNSRPTMVFRDLLKLKLTKNQIPIAEVEPMEAILKRFDSAGMSLGALSPEAHETLAEAMNTLGGRSNSGEGGEDPMRYQTNKSSKIKQVASGRFGVTPHYLVNAEVLQIKIAQGAKPGEGGQLPGHKVNGFIARLRYANEGVSLISPPPHHDIYSIEDLAQLIFDLKQVNPTALVSVKLVAEAGVGTIATGVAKAYADLITISGYDGGTGASPLTSIKYAGSPWELGLPETHAALCANDLRNKVKLQTDGGLKTGLDVIKAAILGAESFGFGTAPMVSMGCKYLRICHLNNCATGVATQNQILRMKHFIGKADMVMNYFKFVATEVREIMAQLGISKLESLIGRVDLLEALEGSNNRQQRLDLSPLLSNDNIKNKPQFCTQKKNDPFDKGELAEQMFADILPAIKNKQGGEFHYRIKNINRSIGARLSGEIARHYGNYDMSDKPVTVNFTGIAGQSFGVWNSGGLVLKLTGFANDYVGKGMAAGEISIRLPAELLARSKDTVIMGNTCLYGATGGKLFAAGLAGERFAVRNSGTIAVVEGIGDHGCEYMTGGVVVILGETGINFGAGMTGGFAFVLDLEGKFSDLYNHSLVDTCRIDVEEMGVHQQYLKKLLAEHIEKTNSQWGQTILNDFSAYLPMFWLVKPKASELNTLISNLRAAA